MVPPRAMDRFAGVTLMDTKVTDAELTVTVVVAVVEVPAAFVTDSV